MGRSAAGLAGVLALAAGCSAPEVGPRTGSETHFLSWCSTAHPCAEGLECVCGVCTLPCSETASCGSLATGAECVPASARSPEQACLADSAGAVCEVTCGVDQDCAALGEAHRCDRGFCRRLAPSCATGRLAGSDVVVLGDAFLAEGEQIVLELTALARGAGALDANEMYRDYSTSLITPFGGAADLTEQYANAVAEGSVRIVIMDVGGPDALLSCPDPPTETCPALANAAAGAEQLWQQMADDGVEAVVDCFYPAPADSTSAAKLDVLRPMLRQACEASPVDCHFLDLAPIFAGRSEQYLMEGGITPTQAGAVATAEAIWRLMRQRCIAQ